MLMSDTHSVTCQSVWLTFIELGMVCDNPHWPQCIIWVIFPFSGFVEGIGHRLLSIYPLAITTKQCDRFGLAALLQSDAACPSQAKLVCNQAN